MDRGGMTGVFLTREQLVVPDIVPGKELAVGGNWDNGLLLNEFWDDEPATVYLKGNFQ